MFAALAIAVAMAAPAAGQVTVAVPATSNPYLSGMPGGSACCVGDVAPAQSPVQVGIAVTPGTVLAFSATGAMHFEPGPLTPTPDGSFIFTTVSSNGIAGATWPADALVGVFLSDDLPTASAAPPALDFSNAGVGLAFTTLSPALKQPFFIGDGRTGTGAGATQAFVVPAGATRLFVGASDGVGWFNNIGGFTVTVLPALPASAVPALAPWLLVLLAVAVSVGARRRLVRR